MNKHLTALLNQHKAFPVVTLHEDATKEEYVVESVDALHISETEKISAALHQTTICATAVGANALQHIASLIAPMLKTRSPQNNAPLDIILAENMRNAKETMTSYLLKEGVAQDYLPGIIAASIGKTAPDVTAHDQKTSPLLTYCDSYNVLTLSKRGWKNPPPPFPELQLAENIEAYVDRKLFIHNLMHCALAYFGNSEMPAVSLISKIVTQNEIRMKIDRIMQPVINALLRTYPQEFTKEDLTEYYMGVAKRISNPLLNDTVYRVGRDVTRKLGRQERIVGALLMVDRNNESTDALIELYCAAIKFNAKNDAGELFEGDQKFQEKLAKLGIEYVLYQVSSFDPLNSAEKRLVLKIENEYKIYKKEDLNNVKFKKYVSSH